MTRPAALALCVLLAAAAPVAMQALDFTYKGPISRVAACVPLTVAIKTTTSADAKLSISGKWATD